MTVTAKDFNAIAEVISDVLAEMDDDDVVAAVVGVGVGLADYFQGENRNFNRARFLEECGIEEHVEEDDDE